MRSRQGFLKDRHIINDTFGYAFLVVFECPLHLTDTLVGLGSFSTKQGLSDSQRVREVAIAQHPRLLEHPKAVENPSMWVAVEPSAHGNRKSHQHKDKNPSKRINQVSEDNMLSSNRRVFRVLYKTHLSFHWQDFTMSVCRDSPDWYAAWVPQVEETYTTDGRSPAQPRNISKHFAAPFISFIIFHHNLL